MCIFKFLSILKIKSNIYIYIENNQQIIHINLKYSAII